MSISISIKYNNKVKKFQLRQNINIEDLIYLISSHFDIKKKILGLRDKSGIPKHYLNNRTSIQHRFFYRKSISSATQWGVSCDSRRLSESLSPNQHGLTIISQQPKSRKRWKITISIQFSNNPRKIHFQQDGLRNGYRRFPINFY